jgi:hypothetical protein
MPFRHGSAQIADTDLRVVNMPDRRSSNMDPSKALGLPRKEFCAVILFIQVAMIPSLNALLEILLIGNGFD